MEILRFVGPGIVLLLWGTAAGCSNGGDEPGGTQNAASMVEPGDFDGADGREAPLAVQTHLHGSLSEFTATMAYHTAQAELYDIDVLWWSDHDLRTLMINRPPGFDFDEGSLTADVELLTQTRTHGLFLQDNGVHELASRVRSGGPEGSTHYWELTAEAADPVSAWESVGFRYQVLGATCERMPLLSGLALGLKVRPNAAVHEDWRFLVSVELSNNLDGEPYRITYFIAAEDLTAQSSPTHLYVPVEALGVREWNEITLALADDAAAFDEQDDLSALHYDLELWVRSGVRAKVDIDEFAFLWDLEGDDLRDYQQEVLDQRYSFGGITHYVGQEITGVEERRHVNPLGAAPTPFVDYAAGAPVALEDAVEHVHDHGHLALCDHPFGTDLGVSVEASQAAEEALAMAETWIAHDAWSCDAVEVGYRARYVDLAHHLMFWDTLADAGYVLTGIGSSDNHWTADAADFANPMVTWVFLDTPSRGAITEEIAGGRVFFGDPVPFAGQQALLDLWSEEGAVMGQVLDTEHDQVVHVETGYVEPGWRLRLVVDGEVFETRELSGDVRDSQFVVPREEHHQVRAELFTADGVVLLASNPLYLTRSGDPRFAGRDLGDRLVSP